MFEITVNDGGKVPIQLLKDGATFNIPSDAVIKACMTSRDRTMRLSDIVTLSNAETGADWSTALIVVSFTGSEINAVENQKKVMMEIQVTESGGVPLTWWEDGVAYQGHIT